MSQQTPPFSCCSRVQPEMIGRTHEENNVSQATQQTTPQTLSTPSTSARGGAWLGPAVGGFVVGILATAVAVYLIMPGMMIVTHESKLGFDETVAAIEAKMAEEGWASPATINLNKSLEKHGHPLDAQVRVVQLCKAEYASDVLKTDRYVSSLMPCAISVWEADDGTVHVSKMNTGLMGKLFGGNIAKVMGGKVAAEERRILAAVLE